MKSLNNERDRREIRERIESLEPSCKPLWGRMNATEMLAHCSAQLRMSWGEIECKPKQSPLGRLPLKQALVYFAPWPKGAPTAPELIRADAENWVVETAKLFDLIERFPAEIEFTSVPHPIFGTLSKRAWGRLGYRHLDHHLRQFGV
ncbi:MAG: DUF1569 domain-containing protein [Thermoanaerobaculia bacterium]